MHRRSGPNKVVNVLSVDITFLPGANNSLHFDVVSIPNNES